MKWILVNLFIYKQEPEVLVFLRKNTFSERTDPVKLVAAERIVPVFSWPLIYKRAPDYLAISLPLNIHLDSLKPRYGKGSSE
jgi:hypothetical protein